MKAEDSRLAYLENVLGLSYLAHTNFHPHLDTKQEGLLLAEVRQKMVKVQMIYLDDVPGFGSLIRADLHLNLGVS